jgi:hypothetical protein
MRRILHRKYSSWHWGLHELPILDYNFAAHWFSGRSNLPYAVLLRPPARGLFFVLAPFLSLHGRAGRPAWAAHAPGLAVIAKRATGLYYSGKRTRDWLKFKVVHEQEVVIVGYTEPRRSRNAIALRQSVPTSTSS